MNRALAVILFCALPSLAWADVVHLKNGSTISGTVVSDDDKGVVIRTPNGKMTLPRHMVKSVVKQSEGQTALSLARERAKAGAYKEAERLFEKATRDPDKKIAAAARRELEGFRARQKRVKGYRQAPRTRWPVPAGLTGKPIEGETLQEQFDRARRAIEAGSGKRAARLIEPLLKSKPDDRVLIFLMGRAHEVVHQKAQARPLYDKVLGRSYERPVAWLSELARRKLAGEKLRSDSAGVHKSWKRIETQYFAIYHRLESPPEWLAKRAEQTLQDVLEAFSIKRRELYFAGRLQVFVFDDRRGMFKDDSLRIEERETIEILAPDGVVNIIRAHPQLTFFETRFRYEVAHAVLGNVFELPAWARAGAASQLLPEFERSKLRRIARDRELAPPSSILAGEVGPGDSRRSKESLQAHGSVLFEVFRRTLKPRPALKLCHQIQRDGAEKALKRFKIDPDSIPQAFAEISRQGN